MCQIHETMNPLVSVIIPTFNSAKYVGQAVESALGQTYGNLEIIVVDDGSSDDTRESLEPSLKHIRYLYQENKGVYAARNKGITSANGKYVAFLDSDDIWYPDKLSAQVDVLEAHPDFPIVHTDTSTIDAEGHLIRQSVNRERQSINGMVFEEFFNSNMAVILLSTVMINRKCFKTVGIFDERYPIVQDYGFFLRLSFEYPIYFLDKPLVKYRITPGSLSRRNTLESIILREQILKEFISEHTDFFDQRPDLVRNKWKSFNTEAAFTLFHSGRYSSSHGYFKKVLGRSLLLWVFYLVTFAPGNFLGKAKSMLSAIRVRAKATGTKSGQPYNDTTAGP